mmetsp:Transcript_5022/g.11444  ORF Transcript_5022/g.11444 Transcript_5022/m.11444 type:complete len:209 (+) Transcript_5022:1804-2430(+)
MKELKPKLMLPPPAAPPLPPARNCVASPCVELAMVVAKRSSPLRSARPLFMRSTIRSKRRAYRAFAKPPRMSSAAVAEFGAVMNSAPALMHRVESDFRRAAGSNPRSHDDLSSAAAECGSSSASSPPANWRLPTSKMAARHRHACHCSKRDMPSASSAWPTSASAQVSRETSSRGPCTTAGAAAAARPPGVVKRKASRTAAGGMGWAW